MITCFMLWPGQLLNAKTRFLPRQFLIYQVIDCVTQRILLIMQHESRWQRRQLQ